jgi:hypothetical protein
MSIVLRYATRRRVDAILLAASAERMRVVVRNQNDTLELHRVGSRWFSDRGSAVEIESIVAGDPAAVARVWSGTRTQVSRASC